MYARPGCRPFVRPVSTKTFPLYKTKIAKPMDLSTIKSRLERYVYRDREGFMADMDLIATNSITFNGPEHPISRRPWRWRAQRARRATRSTTSWARWSGRRRLRWRRRRAAAGLAAGGRRARARARRRRRARLRRHRARAGADERRTPPTCRRPTRAGRARPCARPRRRLSNRAPRRGGPAGGDFLAAAELGRLPPRWRHSLLGRGGGRRGRGSRPIYYGVQVRF